MKRNSGHDWARIFTFWVALFVAVVVSTGMATEVMGQVPGTLSIITITVVGSELIGRD